jgi:hypothetical protein
MARGPQQKRARRPSARPAKKAPARPPEPDTVALIDCGGGDLFELVEQRLHGQPLDQAEEAAQW